MEKTRSTTNLFKRFLSLALALVMLLGMVPVTHAHAAEGTTLYLEPNENWLQADARFAIYYWNNSGSHWTDMSDEDGDYIYSGTVPAGYSNIIFCRMNPGAAANDWNSKWNQTSDLTVPTDGTNCYSVADGTWDNGGGTWSYYEEDTEEPEVPTTAAPVESEPEEDDALYIVAGDSALCGSNWAADDTANRMTRTADGTYEKIYANVPAGTYNLKVTNGTWDQNWGDNGQNYTFTVTAKCDVTVSFDPATGTVSVTGSNVGKETGLDISEMVAVGNGSGNWLNGANWDVAASANVMTETASNVYEITFEDVAAGTAYEFKFAANKSWTHSWGSGGAEGEAVYNGQNIKLSIPYALADVTLKLDMTGYNHSTKTGAVYSVAVTEAVAEPEVPEEPSVDYYLVGYINGADYGCNDDWENLGEYKFEDGKLSAAFTHDSYVFIKTGDNAHWYLFPAYTTDTTGTLAEGNGEKMFVPGGKDLEFTLVENDDGTLTLSYAEKADTTDVTLHFFKPDTWGSTVNAYLWISGAVPGYEAYNSWPGKAITPNAAHAGWYDLTVSTAEPMAFNFIFNDGGNQTADLSTGAVTGDTELWIVGNDVMTAAPGEWSGDYDYTANLHFKKPDTWNSGINAWIWDANGAIPGYEDYNTTWPGKAVDADAINAGWYNVSVTVDENAGFNFIFNDGSNQTADLSTGVLNVKTDLWIVDGTVLTAAPAGWKDPSRTVHVPGTFPGPSWDASSNQMSWVPELGLYVYTFENVPPANYEYKIAINGSWNENYGAAGVRDGANIAVAVTETTDVTVYYNDETHNSVTSVSYVFADVTLSGTGIPEGTKMTDKGLSGIYSVTVPMVRGVYTDLVITCDKTAENFGEVTTYAFGEVKIEEDKDVTFYLDPVTEIFYCDASDIPVNTKAIYFDSQDAAYKQPFGAVATGEDVRFAIDTGADVTSAVLVVKGLGSWPMAAEDTATGKRWSATASFQTIGEYDYYFSLSNGSTIAIYSDDDGYYGEGKVTDLTSVKPYDLVVYKSGFQTPDWMKDAVIYQIFPDRFFDGDVSNNQAQTWARGEVDYEYITNWYTLPENPEQEGILSESEYKATGAHWGDGQWSNEIYGGDLEGITQRIGYLKALGVNVIYLNPIFWSISNHRYDAVDYTEIDPILGTMGDFNELVKVAEANGMHIILDGVFNHVSDDSVYFDRYYKFLGTSNKIGAYPYWAYVYDYMAETKASQADAEAAAKAYFSANYGITDYSYTAWFKVSSSVMAGTVDRIGLRAGKEVYSYEGWWGYDSMPVIYSTNGSEYQTGNWAEEIIYNANETSVTQFWIAKGNNGWRLDVANEVSDETWQRFRDSVKALDSDAVIIGEIWDDATKYLKGDMYDSVMNYLFRNAATSFAMGSNAADTMKQLEKIRERYPEEAFYAMMNLVGSHDTTRLLSYLDGIGDDRNDKSPAAAFPTYANTSDEAKQMQYLVAFLQFTYAGAPTIYYGDEIGMVGSDDPDDRRAMEWGKGSKDLVEWYAKLAAIREAYPALRTGSIQPLDLENSYDLLGYVRRDENNTITVIANNAFEDVDAGITGEYIDLITGKTFDGTVPACSGVILVAQDEVKTVSVNYAGLAPAYDPAYTVAQRPAPETVHTHKYEAKVTAPTCTENGYTTYTCSCGDSYISKEVAALGHSEDAVVTDPTCTEEGFTTYTCSECGNIRTDDVTPAAGHRYSYTDADGIRTYLCTVCGHSYESTLLQMTSGKSLTLKFVNPATGNTVSASKANWEITGIRCVNPEYWEYAESGQDMDEYSQAVDPENFAAYASVKNGKLTTKKNGDSVYITVKASLKSDAAVTATFTLEVLPASTKLSIWAMGHSLAGTINWNVNPTMIDPETEYLELEAYSFPSNAKQEVTWKSSNSKIMTVDEQGVLRPVFDAKKGEYKTGTVTITATAKDGSGKKASFKVAISKFAAYVEISRKDGKALEQLPYDWYYEWNEELQEDVMVVTEYIKGAHASAGTKLNLKATVDPNASSKKVIWYCTSQYAKISNGTLTIDKSAPSSHWIWVTACTSDGRVYDEILVIVDNPVSEVEIWPYYGYNYSDSDGTVHVNVSNISSEEDIVPVILQGCEMDAEGNYGNTVTSWSISGSIATAKAVELWWDDTQWEYRSDLENMPEDAYTDWFVAVTPKWDAAKGMPKTGTVTLTGTADDGKTKKSVKITFTSYANQLEIDTKDGKNIADAPAETYWNPYLDVRGTDVNGGWHEGKVAFATAGQTLNLVGKVNANASSKKVYWWAYCPEYPGSIKFSNGKLTIGKDIPTETLVWVQAYTMNGDVFIRDTWIPVVVTPVAANVHLRADFSEGMKYVSNSTKVWDINQGMELPLSVLVYPFAADQKVNWTVSSKAIASVEDNGNGTATLKFTGTKFGKLTVTATAADGSKVKTSFTLNVVKSVQSISLKDDAVLTVAPGKTLKLASQITLNPSTATNKKLEWTIVDAGTTGAKINKSSGVLTAAKGKTGEVTVLVKALDGFGAELLLTVTVK